MDLGRVTFLNSGYCTQWSNLAGRPTWRRDRFHAVFVYLEHPRFGAALIDAGYGPPFLEATRRFPERLYRWLTPANIGPGPAEVLRSQGLDPAAIRTIFVSHFHGDHIAGLADFPAARFVHRRDVLDRLRPLGAWQRLHHGFLADLLPADFAERGDPFTSDAFRPGVDEWSEFRVLDWWGDGSVVLVDLPGHADGHMGYLLRTPTGPVFYIVDACWDIDVMMRAGKLPFISRRVQHSYTAYVDTQAKLRRLLARAAELPMWACHCPRTQRHVANAAG